LLYATAAHALTISVHTKSVPSVTPSSPLAIYTLRLTGPIEPGDSEALRRILVSLDARPRGVADAPLATAELSSIGGDLIEGLKIGYLFSEFNVATVVRKGGRCLSACALAFLGGTAFHDAFSGRSRSCSLEIGGVVGFHNFTASTDASRKDAESRAGQTSERSGFFMARAGAALIVHYAADMGIDPKLIGRMLGRSSEDFEYITTAQAFLSLGICPIGLGLPGISPAEQAANICNHSMGWRSPANSSRARSMTAGHARLHLLEFVQSHMQSFKVKGALSDQLASYSVMRNDKGVESLYADLRAAAVPLPEMVGPVFEVDGYQIGVYGLTCIVSLSLDNPGRYDVVIKGPKGLARVSRSAPDDCRGLFRYDWDAVINP
jgi:hypothetical protein